MLKRILAGVFIGASILAISSFSYATDTNEKGIIDKTKVEQAIMEQTKTEETKAESKIESTVEEEIDISKYRIIRPEKSAYTIEEKVDFVNGIAPVDTTVT
ncbi:MAG: hypothetical protein WCY46_02390, partial [Tissierellaceae bacterium]